MADHTSGDLSYGRAQKPWERLPAGIADLMDPKISAIREEILESIGREIPAYTRPLSGAFGEAVRGGVDQALAQFVAMVRDPETSMREEGTRIYAALGRAEMEAGRSIGALLAAYRIGAQVAWRQMADVSIDAGIDQRASNLLAESIFAYIDELSAESAEGYAQAQAERAGELDARRAELIDLLVRGSIGSDRRALSDMADAARWNVPAELAVLVWPAELGRPPAARLPQNSIFALRGDEFVALIPEPRDPQRVRQVERGFAEVTSGLGSVAAPLDAATSFAHARVMLEISSSSPRPTLVHADANRTSLIAGSDPLLAAEIERDLLAPLADETPASRERLRETLLAWLRRDGNVALAADDLHVHVQTLRYRLSRLRELLGDALDDPERRYELEFALRAGSGAER